MESGDDLMPENKQPNRIRIVSKKEGRELFSTTVDSLALGACWNIKGEGLWYTTDFYKIDTNEEWTVIVSPEQQDAG